MDRVSFEHFLDLAIAGALPNISKPQKKYTYEKGTQLFDLLVSLKSRGFLMALSPQEKVDLRKQLAISAKNMGELSSLINMLIDLIRENAESPNPRDGGYFILKSELGREHHLTASQAVVLMGCGYVALLEFAHQWISLLIDFNQLHSRNGNRDSTKGIGELRDRIQLHGFVIDFFSDYNNKLRNAFAHLDFELMGDKIRYDTTKYIPLPDFLKISINADRADFAIMTVFTYYLGQS